MMRLAKVAAAAVLFPACWFALLIAAHRDDDQPLDDELEPLLYDLAGPEAEGEPVVLLPVRSAGAWMLAGRGYRTLAEMEN